MKTYSVVMTEGIHSVLFQHLKREDQQEDLCFALWNYSNGASRYSAVLHEVVLPIAGDRNLHGDVSFNPQYLDRVLQLAMKKNMGICLLHGHFTSGWQGMSPSDIKTEKYLAPIIKATTGLNFLGLTMGIDGAWSARFWLPHKPGKFKRQWCKNVRVIGNKYSVTFYEKAYRSFKAGERLLRTISAWGIPTQTKLSRLTIGIVGAGSVGSIIAESLAKIGITKVKLIDFDALEEKNLDRTLHARKKHIGKAKAKILATAIKGSAVMNGFRVEGIDYSLMEEIAFRKALDCDILFSCVDRPWPRYVLDKIAFAHLIPVIDGGISVQTNQTNSGMISADWKTNTILPGRPCMECLGQYSPEDVALEKAGLLDDVGYISSLDANHFVHRNENVFVFSLGLGFLEMQQFLSLVIAPFGLGNIGGKVYHFITGSIDDEKVSTCGPTCTKPSALAQGDKATIGIPTRHFKAEDVRHKREQKSLIKNLNRPGKSGEIIKPKVQ